MKISIVTISYNQRQYLQQCISSVIDQADQGLEYIIVDPGSTDGSRNIIDGYGAHVLRVYERGAGPADGLNKGFAKATGDIFGFINADDLLLPGALYAVREAFDSAPTMDILCGNGNVIDSQGNVIRHVTATKLTQTGMLFGACTVFQQGTFFRRSAFQAVGGFNIHNRTCWDGELFLQMLLRGSQCMHLPRDLAAFRIYSDSISGSGRLLTQYKADQARIFRSATGRDWRWSDSLTRFALRSMKVIRRVAGRQERER